MKEVKINELIKAIIYGTIIFFIVTIIGFILLNTGAMIFQHKTIIDLFIIWNTARLQLQADYILLSTNFLSSVISILIGVCWGTYIWMFLPKEDSL